MSNLFQLTLTPAIDFGPTPKGTAAPPILNVIFVSSTAGMTIGDTIEIMLDNGEFFRTTITGIPASGQILIAHGLPFRASAGNIVVDLTQSNNVAPVNMDDLT